MLVLSRKRAESILIGNDITVTVLEVRGDRVKLGFSARGEVAIHRGEVYQSIENGSSDPEYGVPLAMHSESSCPELQGTAV
jgi:carbon storage regulator